MSTKLMGLTIGVLLAVFGLGLVAPPRAQANDTGKVLLGIVAGALLYGLLSSDRDCDRDNQCYQRDRDAYRFQPRPEYYRPGRDVGFGPAWGAGDRDRNDARGGFGRDDRYGNGRREPSPARGNDDRGAGRRTGNDWQGRF
jgi:hypothetical protein